jgi:hypothetical protein
MGTELENDDIYEVLNLLDRSTGAINTDDKTKLFRLVRFVFNYDKNSYKVLKEKDSGLIKSGPPIKAPRGICLSLTDGVGFYYTWKFFYKLKYNIRRNFRELQK